MDCEFPSLEPFVWQMRVRYQGIIIKDKENKKER